MSDNIKLVGPRQRAYAKQQIDAAPDGWRVTIKEPKRSDDQNAKLWAMLSDIAKAEPMGRKCTQDRWKCIMMKACAHEVQYETDLQGDPFPVGFRSSHMGVKQMSELIEFMYWFGAQHDIAWSEKVEA